jgi:hypothetical protein
VSLYTIDEAEDIRRKAVLDQSAPCPRLLSIVVVVVVGAVAAKVPRHWYDGAAHRKFGKNN